MNRTETRELAFQLIYSLEIQKVEDKKEQIELYLTSNGIEDKKVEKYVLDVVEGLEKNNEEILKMIQENLKQDWSIERVSKINFALLQLGIYEIVYAKVPYKVVINEVVELAKKYGDNTSPAFVNGILASVVKKTQEEQ